MRIAAVIVISFFFSFSNAQVFWTENFNTGAGWTLANVTGAEGSDPNFFQITANEGGNIAPNMGAPTSCGVANNGNNTMHVTSVFFPGGGAAYDAGGLCGFLFCPQTNRRAQSPVINCTGQSGITLTFAYIEGGQGGVGGPDNATCWYFNGAVWAQIDDMPKTATGCGGQGLWVTRSVALPASADNNANVRVGFRWVNNDDGIGTDPSFAVDNMSLSVVVLPIELISFTAESRNEGIALKWKYINEGGMSGYAIERSENGTAFSEISFLKETGQARMQDEKEYTDAATERGVSYYYRLRSVEKDGSFRFSSVITAKREPGVRDIKAQYSNGAVVLQHNKGMSGQTQVQVIDVEGNIVARQAIDHTANTTLINVEGIASGIYFCRIVNGDESVTIKLPVW